MSSTAIPQLELEALRTRSGLRKLADELEGVPLGRLPGGIYGFGSAAPELESPLYGTRVHQTFEFHKLTSGEIRVLGFVPGKDAAALESAKDTLDVKLYPEPFGDAQTLVSVPFGRIHRAKAPSRTDGNYIAMSVDPA